MIDANVFWQIGQGKDLSEEGYGRLPYGLWIANIGEENVFSFRFELLRCERNQMNKQHSVNFSVIVAATGQAQHSDVPRRLA